MDRVAPSARLEEQIAELLTQGLAEDGERLAEAGRLGARLVLQRAVEDEVTAFLGRARYQRTAEATGSRSGTRRKPVQTAEGEIGIDSIAVQRLERALTANSFRAYLPTIFGLFTFLETDRWQISAQRRWDDAPDPVRKAIEDYPFQHFGCQLGLEHNGHILVSLTAASLQTVKQFLSALKTFYWAAAQEGSVSESESAA